MPPVNRGYTVHTDCEARSQSRELTRYFLGIVLHLGATNNFGPQSELPRHIWREYRTCPCKTYRKFGGVAIVNTPDGRYVR